MHPKAKEAQTVRKSAPQIVRFPLLLLVAARLLLLLDDDEERALAAMDQQERRAGVCTRPNSGVEFRYAVDKLAVNRFDDITLLQAGIGRPGGLIDLGHNHASGARRKLELTAQVRTNVLYGNAGESRSLTTLRDDTLLLPVFLACDLVLHLRKGYGGILLAAATEELQIDLGSGRHSGDLQTELVHVRDGSAVDGGDHITGLETGALRRTIGFHARDRYALEAGIAKPAGDIGSDFLGKNTHETARYLAVFQNLVHDVAGQVDGNRETDTLIAAALAGENGGVDTDQFAMCVDQGAARVAGVNGGVGLDEIFELLDGTAEAAAGRAHDSHRDRLAHAKGVANCQYDIADLRTRGIAKRQDRQILLIDLQNRHVGGLIGAHDLGGKFTLIVEGHFHLRGAFDDVVVGQNVAVRAHNYARAEAFGAAFSRHLRHASTEEAA